MLGDVNAPAVIPAILEPAGEFLGGIVVKDINVKFALIGQASQSEVAGAEKPRNGVVGVGPETEIKFGVKGMAEEKFHDHFSRFKLARKPPKTGFIGIVGRPEGQLGAKILGESAL